MTFDKMGLDPKIMKAIQEVGYTEPTPIQAQAIPVVLQGKDVLGIAQTGTGKTASFTLPMIHRLMKGRAKARMPRTLILEPTRELAAQVADNFDLYGKHTRLSKALLIGGVSFKDQEIAITRGADVLIATPGRLLDHVERGGVLLRGVEVLVIDEADRMLDMGFIPDIEKIVKLLPFTRQTLFFSATMPPEITRLADQFLSAPERIEVARPSSANATVTHKLVPTTRDGKREALRVLLRRDSVKNGIIFCNRKKDISVLNGSMTKHGFAAVCLHGDMDQYTRMDMLERFKSGDAKFLIASDVAARGLDIPDVSHVFNFDVPTHAEDYVHRIGRTGRAGKTGEAFTLSTPSDGKYVDAIEKMLDQKIDIEEIDTLSPRTKPRRSEEQKDKPRSSEGRNRRGPPKDGAEQTAKGKRRGLLGRKGKKDTPSKDMDTKVTQTQNNASAKDEKKPELQPKRGKGFGDNVPAFMKNGQDG
ncbi:MAG: DEAD/DEAH box helicase [Parvibaculales bacterium]